MHDLGRLDFTHDAEEGGEGRKGRGVDHRARNAWQSKKLQHHGERVQTNEVLAVLDILEEAFEELEMFYLSLCASWQSGATGTDLLGTSHRRKQAQCCP